jgi:hypothetical protein
MMSPLREDSQDKPSIVSETFLTVLALQKRPQQFLTYDALGTLLQCSLSSASSSTTYHSASLPPCMHKPMVDTSGVEQHMPWHHG